MCVLFLWRKWKSTMSWTHIDPQRLGSILLVVNIETCSPSFIITDHKQNRLSVLPVPPCMTFSCTLFCKLFRMRKSRANEATPIYDIYTYHMLKFDNNKKRLGTKQLRSPTWWSNGIHMYETRQNNLKYSNSNLSNQLNKQFVLKIFLIYMSN